MHIITNREVDREMINLDTSQSARYETRENELSSINISSEVEKVGY